MASRGDRKATGFAVDQDLPGIRLVQPVEDVHEGALPGAVLAEEGVHLARGKPEVDVVVGDDAGEALGDPAELDGRHRVGRRPRASAHWTVVRCGG